MDDDNLIPISALQHYLYCPRQCALIHVEQLWAENRQTAEGRLLHQGRIGHRSSSATGCAPSQRCPLSTWSWVSPA